jgi:hypothetical protein
MLRSNLATRPFYNERLVSLALALVAVVALGLTIFNATRLVTLLGDRSGIQARIRADRAEADRVSAHAAALQKGIDRATIARLTASTREANSLIDERTFSWSALFARLERTLPLDVRIVAVSPEVGQTVLKVSMNVVAKELDDVAEFIDNLSDTGVFYDVQPTEQRFEEDNTYTALIVASYLPGRAEPAAATDAPTPPSASPAGPARGTANTGGRQ